MSGILRKTHRDSEFIDADAVNAKRLYSFKVTLTGGASHAVTLADYGVPEMADTDYAIMVGGEATLTLQVDESETTTKAFTIINGGVGGTDVAHVMIHGTPKYPLDAD
jgi:hypothetical protein